jgi:hypothetical protein
MRSRAGFSKYLTRPKFRSPVVMVIGENPVENVDDRRVALMTVEPDTDKRSTLLTLIACRLGALALIFEKPTLMSLAQNGTSPSASRPGCARRPWRRSGPPGAGRLAPRSNSAPCSRSAHAAGSRRRADLADIRGETGATAHCARYSARRITGPSGWTRRNGYVKVCQNE